MDEQEEHVEESRIEDPPRLFIYKDLMLWQLAALVFLLDQFSKYLVREFLEFRTSYPDVGFFRFTHIHNTGSAFGLFQDQNFPLILVSFVGIGVLVLIYRSQRRPSTLLRLSLGLQFGGAAGNLLDRLRLDHVTDFVDVGAWPIFNVADASIVTGLVILAWVLMLSDRSKAPDPAANIDAGPEGGETDPSLGSEDGGNEDLVPPSLPESTSETPPEGSSDLN